jgi:nicotinate-nucleotide pyrophosphorylase (carboxylating)
MKTEILKLDEDINTIPMDDIDRFLHEDLGEKGDVTSQTLFTTETAEASIIAKETCIVAGLEEVQQVFHRLGVRINNRVRDGERVEAMTIIATLKGSIRKILMGERLALNFLGRMSGIATETNALARKVRAINPRVTIAATRKTTPGFRAYEKKAVIIGGGEPHRFGLFDAIMIKDNHIVGCGSLQEAIGRVTKHGTGKTIEVEVENEHDALLAASMNVDVIMLDNIPPEKGKVIAKAIRAVNSKILIEVSGGITPSTIEKYASYADRISLGYITHSSKARDFSLDLHIKT